MARSELCMEPSQIMNDEAYRNRVLKARRTPPAEKILKGFGLFEEECDLIRSEIRIENPALDDGRVEELLRARLNEQRSPADGDLYVTTMEELVAVVVRRIQSSAHPQDRTT